MNRYLVLVFLLIAVTSGCGVQVANEVQGGRAALSAGNPDLAIISFKRVAESQPDYVVDSPPLREGIWTYLGRAYYDSGKLPEAREALSQALKRDDADFMARLYLGIVLLREGGPLPKADNAFSLNDVIYALRERVSSKRVAGLVKERGTKFDLTAQA